MNEPTEAEVEAAAAEFTNLVHAALMEGGRPDLAVEFLVFIEDDGTPYVEPMDELTGADLAIVSFEHESKLHISPGQMATLRKGRLM